MTARDRWVMAALMVGIMLSPINVVITAVALPTMRDYFNLNVEQATWIGTAYYIPAVAFMPLQTVIGEHWGIRRVYSLGMLLLCAGALLAAAAPSFQWLLSSRVLQGIGWSALYPLALILIRRQYPAGQQGGMMGLWESSVGAATVVSPIVAGVLVQFFGWRSLYLTMGLVAGAGVFLIQVAVPATRSKNGESALRKEPNWAAAVGLTVALTLLLLGITRRLPLLILVSAFAWLAWIALTLNSTTAFISPALFKNRRFVSASLAANIRMLVAVAALIALPLFFEDIQGLVPSMVGSLLVVYSLFLFLAAWPGGRWSDRSGAAVPGAVGYVAMIIGVLLLLTLTDQLVVWLVVIALALRGLGAGLSQAPYGKAATDAVPDEESRAAAGLYGTLRYGGLALGTALVGIFLQTRLTHYDALDGGLAALPVYREFWLLLAAILVIGLGLTAVMGYSRPVIATTSQEVVN